MEDEFARSRDIREAFDTQARTTPRSPGLLVIEDDEDMQLVFGRVVRSIDPDIVVDWAVDARQAIDRLRTSDYGAIVADYLLPGNITGLGVRPYCLRCQPDAAFAMMSAYPLKDLLAAPDRDSFPVLRKPFTVPECREFLRTLLSASR